MFREVVPVKKGRGWILAYVLTIAGALCLVHWGSSAVTVISEQMPILRQHCIVIDPGHGGVDGGATSCTGRLESGYNLEISLKLRDLLHLLGYETRMIRTVDESVYTKGETISQKKISDLKERVRISNESPGNILISIHQNMYPDSRFSGAQVFFAGTEGSEALGTLLQQNLKTCLHTRRQEKKSSGVYLMDHIECTGILVECGFLSNPEEEAKLSDPVYQRKLCCVIAGTLSQFLG